MLTTVGSCWLKRFLEIVEQSGCLVINSINKPQRGKEEEGEATNRQAQAAATESKDEGKNNSEDGSILLSFSLCCRAVNKDSILLSFSLCCEPLMGSKECYCGA